MIPRGVVDLVMEFDSARSSHPRVEGEVSERFGSVLTSHVQSVVCTRLTREKAISLALNLQVNVQLTLPLPQLSSIHHERRGMGHKLERAHSPAR